MTSVLDVRPGSPAAPDVLFGAQRPRVRLVPPGGGEAAGEAIDLAASVGVELDPWQRYALEDAMGVRADGKWSAFEVGVVVARQNGKGKIIEARELFGLLLGGERLILHSAHEVKTATEAFIRVKELFTEWDDLRKEVRRVNNSHGEEGIELLGGARLRFIARSRVAGRGFSGDCVILDEAFCLADSAMAALFPTMAAKPNPQIWYTSSAVNQRHHNHGYVLARLRRRGHAGGSRRLAYLEWSPDVEGMSPPERAALRVSREAWALTNPGLGYRISEEYIQSELEALDALDFDTERLSIGDWPAPDGELRWEVIAEQAWTALADPDGERPARVAFAFAVSPERDRAVIAVAGFRSDGTLHVEIPAGDDGADDYRDGTAWVIPRLVQLKERWKPVAVVADPRGAEGALLDEAAEAGVEVTTITAGDLTAACGQWYDRVARGTLRHAGQRDLDRAVGGARKRMLTGGAWAWEVAGLEVEGSPLRAATLAAWGAAHARATVPLFARG